MWVCWFADANENGWTYLVVVLMCVASINYMLFLKLVMERGEVLI